MFQEIISLKNLFEAWKEFRRGKANRLDVQAFEWRLEDHVFALHEDLRNGTYQHGTYESFYVCDPKRRHIHKPPVRDRLLHHAIFRVIERLFERKFIFDAWSCRKNKGTHAAITRFQMFGWKLSRNNTKNVWILKLDVQKFFRNVDQAILLSILSRTIKDEQTMKLLKVVIRSFDQGIPLGNLTSQLFANVYLNELDQFVKHELKMRWYLRYCDDFVLLHDDREILVQALPRIQTFLSEQLQLILHPDKIILKRYHHGIDFLGFVCFPHYRTLRVTTKRRMLRRASKLNLTSYLGLIQHGRSFRLREQLLKKASL